MNIPFIDLAAQQSLIREKVDARIATVLNHGAYVLGPEVKEFESALADFAGVQHAVSCANGTDALQLALMCEYVGVGDAVFLPSFTFVATAEAPMLAGASLVFVDVDEDTFNMSPESLEAAIIHAQNSGLRSRAIIAVDLFGQPADYVSINAIADKYGCFVIADAAQSFGGSLNDKPVGGWADFTTTSFFPAKPLGCYGDGGAVIVEDAERASRLMSLRMHGQGEDKYDNIRVGVNSRLDTIQAAILIEKLEIFGDELKKRDAIAERYNRYLGDMVHVPVVAEGAFSAWAQYTICVDNRDDIIAALKEDGVPTAIYYPRPIHMQQPYESCLITPEGLPATEKRAGQVLSLPMHPYLSEDVQDIIINSVRKNVA